MHRQHLKNHWIVRRVSFTWLIIICWKTTKLSAKPPSAFLSVCRPDEDEPILFSLTSALTNNWQNSQMGFKLLVKDLKDPRVISLSTQINWKRNINKAITWISECIADKNGTRDKLHWRWKPENVRRTALLGGIYQRCRRRAYFYFSSKYFSFHHCISGEHSDPSCPTQGNFTSSAVQTPVS